MTETQIAQWVSVIGAFAVALSLRVYWRIGREIRRVGGRVGVSRLGLPELMIGTFLLVFLAGDFLATIYRPEPRALTNPLGGAETLEQSLILAVFPIGLVIFMSLRGVQVRRLYGFHRLSLFHVVRLGLGLLIAVLPVLFVINLVCNYLLGDDAVAQPLVQVYQQAAKEKQLDTLWCIGISAVVIAPFTEEILFRGFFYPVFKRKLGGFWSLLLTSLIFAAIHKNLYSFTGLAILAIALTLAYEWTGSLLVPMVMHASFNALSLLAMLHMSNHDPMKLSALGEDAVVAGLIQKLPSAADVRVGPGSDCAIVGGKQDKLWTVLKTDCVVESVHFSPTEKPERIGWKALCRAVSDVAACGGWPRHALVTVAASPKDSMKRLVGIYDGLSKAARRFKIAIVGGETSKSPGPLFINVTLTGSVERRFAVSRFGGKAGDALFVTGRLGGSIRGKHLDFIPRLEEARWLVKNHQPRAMMDLSDGLAQDLPRLAEASGCSFELWQDQIPRTRGCDLGQAMNDGEDFELLFSMAKTKAADLQERWTRKFPGVPLTHIGKFNRRNLPSTKITARGFDHFA